MMVFSIAMQARSISMKLINIAEVSEKYHYSNTLETVKKITQIDTVKDLKKYHPRLNLLGHTVSILDIPTLKIADRPHLVRRILFFLDLYPLKTIFLEVPLKPPKYID